MSESSQEKTEKATPKRLREARDKGQVAKSKDLMSIGSLVAVFATLSMVLGYMGKEIQQFFTLVFSALEEPVLDGATFWELGKAAVFTMGKVLAPIFGAAIVADLVIGYAQVGGILSFEPLKPQMNKLNPIEGLKNIFKATTFIELIKNIAKIILVFLFAYQSIRKHVADLLLSSKVDMIQSLQITGSILFDFMIRVCIAFAVIAIIDYAVQHWQFMKQMKMSKEEVKREYKQDEGDPEVKRERKRIHRDMVFGDARQAVKKSSAVVTNPTHIAIAIEYDGTANSVPVVATKGMRLFAEKIKSYAEEFEVPIFRNVSLAWALYDVEVGDEVPEALFDAVAEILAVVYRLEKEGNPKDISAVSPEYV